jgi:endonuclease/exonuclease/phosphatase family metal-dependent hydrolase
VIIVSWNVLHRIHAVNWSDSVIGSWPREMVRAGSIADAINVFAADVVCLQEVSGDTLAMLRDVVTGEIFATPYPRVPALRQQAKVVLTDPTEYLVTIVRAAARLVSAEAFPTDGGKGFQRVELASGETIITTHVTYGDKRTAQLARLAEEARKAPGLCVIAGDFNADLATCAAELGDEFVAEELPASSLPTRPRQEASNRSQNIDHLFVRGGTVRESAVIDGEGRSDHNPVRVVVER